MFWDPLPSLTSLLCFMGSDLHCGLRPFQASLMPTSFYLTGISFNEILAHLIPSWYLPLVGPGLTHWLTWEEMRAGVRGLLYMGVISVQEPLSYQTGMLTHNNPEILWMLIYLVRTIWPSWTPGSGMNQIYLLDTDDKGLIENIFLF